MPRKRRAPVQLELFPETLEKDVEEDPHGREPAADPPPFIVDETPNEDYL